MMILSLSNPTHPRHDHPQLHELQVLISHIWVIRYMQAFGGLEESFFVCRCDVCISAEIVRTKVAHISSPRFFTRLMKFTIFAI